MFAGNGCVPGVGKSSTLVGATLLDMKSDTVLRNVKYKEIRVKFDSPGAERWLILDVEVKAVPNVDLQKRGLLIKGPQNVAEWLNPDAKMRVAFFGAARDYGLAIRWEPPYEPTDHRDPHFLSIWCQWFQSDIFSAVFGCHEVMRQWRGVISKSDAQKWIPSYLFPVELAGAILFQITNFEIIVRPPPNYTAKELWIVMKSFMALHQEIGGRCEFRYGPPGSKLYIDVSLQRQLNRPFKLLAELGFKSCALHPGKFTQLSTEPLEQLTLAQMNGFV